MKLVSGIVDSGFFAQSALSAEVATKDSLGRNISETYLTAVDIPESANWNGATTVVNNNSAIWNNTTNIVSANSAQWANITAIIPTVDSNTISYSAKPTDNPIYASGNDLNNVDSIQGKSNLAIVPSGVLQVPEVITAVNGNLFVQNSITAINGGLYVPNLITARTNSDLQVHNVLTANPRGITAAGLSADSAFGLSANGLTADAHIGFSANGISAGKSGPLFIEGQYESICANNATGFTFSSQNTALGTAQLGIAQGNSVVQMYAPKFEARNISGAGFSIEASGAKGYNESGNVVWDTQNPQVKNIISYRDTKTAVGGLNGNIILTVMPSTNASNLTSSPYVIMDAEQASYFAAYGPSAQTPTVKLVPGTITLDYAADNTKTTVGYNDIKQESGGSAWTLTGSIQKRELEYDANTSAITAIAGSAIGGQGGELPEAVSAATDYVTANSAAINGTVETVSANSGAWGGSALPISAGPGIKFEMVDNTLVASTQGPILDKITIAGTWNGHEVKQMLQSGIFETNVNSDVIPVNSAYSAASSKWIDPANSYIQYGSTSNILPSTWVLGATGRLGSLSLLNGIVKVRSNDTTNTQCTAFVTIKWCEN